MRRTVTASIAVFGLMLAAASEQTNAQTPRPVSASFGTADVMPQLGRQKMPALPGLKPTDGLDAEIVVSITGAIAHVRVIGTTDTTGELGRACVGAMLEWKLQPARTPSGEVRATLVGIRFKASPSVAGNTTLEVMLYPIAATLPPPMGAPDGSLVEAPGKSGITWPKVIREIKPSYTPDAMRHKLQGAVEMEVVVQPDGTVGAARVVKGLDYGLSEAALAAAHYWLFEPGKRNGEPVATKVGLVLEYRLH